MARCCIRCTGRASQWELLKVLSGHARCGLMRGGVAACGHSVAAMGRGFRNPLDSFGTCLAKALADYREVVGARRFPVPPPAGCSPVELPPGEACAVAASAPPLRVKAPPVKQTQLNWLRKRAGPAETSTNEGSGNLPRQDLVGRRILTFCFYKKPFCLRIKFLVVREAANLGYCSSFVAAKATQAHPSGGLGVLSKHGQPQKRYEKGEHWQLGRWSHHLLTYKGGLHIYNIYGYSSDDSQAPEKNRVFCVEVRGSVSSLGQRQDLKPDHVAVKLPLKLERPSPGFQGQRIYEEPQITDKREVEAGYLEARANEVGLGFSISRGERWSALGTLVWLFWVGPRSPCR
eukprot:1856468-Amphidinium_carterae.3